MVKMGRNVAGVPLTSTVPAVGEADGEGDGPNPLAEYETLCPLVPDRKGKSSKEGFEKIERAMMPQ